MKRKIIAVLTFIAVLGLSGCDMGNSAQTTFSASEESKAAESIQAVEQRSLIRPVITANEDSLYDLKKKMIRLECIYETIALDDESAKKYPELDKALKTYSEEILAEQKRIIGLAKEDPDLKEGWEFYSFANFYFDVERADSEIFSLQTTKHQFFGGMHPNTFVEGVSFNSKTGKKIELTDIVVSKEALIATVKQYLLDHYGKERFAWDLDDSMKEYLQNPEYDLKWYITPDGLCVCFDPYILSSYYAGRFMAFLPFADYPNLFKGDYKASEEAFIYPIPQETSIDIDRDGILETINIHPELFDYEKQNYTSCMVTYDGISSSSGGLNFRRSEAVAIHTADNKNYVYAFIGDNQGYTNTLVFELKGSHASYIGIIEGAMAMHDPNKPDEAYNKEETIGQRVFYPIVNPESFVLQKRVNNSSEKVTEAEYMVGEDGTPVVKQ